MLSRILLFEAVNFFILLELELVDIFVELGNFVHESFIMVVVFSHLEGVLLKESIFLELDFLECSDFLGYLCF